MTLDPAVGTLSAASFPHIVDAVLDAASPAVLVSFRNTSSEYRKRITPARIARAFRTELGTAGLHLHLNVGPAATAAAAAMGAAIGGAHGRDASARVPLVATLSTRQSTIPAPRYLAHWVHIVTLHAATAGGDFELFAGPARILGAAGATLGVVRIVDFEGASARIPFKAPKFVLFMNADDHETEGDEGDEPAPFGLPPDEEEEGIGAAGPASESPFPDNVNEIVCNIACSPSVGCTNLTRSQISALNLCYRVLSNIIYIFRPNPEDARGKGKGKGKGGGELSRDKVESRATSKNIDMPERRRPSASASSSAGSSPRSSPSGSLVGSPALVPFIDSQLSLFPSPGFTIVGCENLRYWDDDPETTLFARFASIMNTYGDLDFSFQVTSPTTGLQVEVALGFDLFYNDNLSRSNYFKSYPQWTASAARTPHERAWYELMAMP